MLYQLGYLMAFGIYFLQVKVLKISDKIPEDLNKGS